MPNTIRPRISIAIADDHPALVKGLKYIIDTFEQCHVVMEAKDGGDLINQIEKCSDKPNICILDLNMPNINGYDALRIIKKNWNEIKVIIMSIYYTEYSILKGFRVGASAFLPKEASPTELFKAIMNVHEKGYYHSELVGNSLNNLANKSSIISQLNEKEIEFLKHVCTDMHYNEIAKIMCVSSRTVDNYRDHLFSKLNCKTRTALAVFAIKNALHLD